MTSASGTLSPDRATGQAKKGGAFHANHATTTTASERSTNDVPPPSFDEIVMGPASVHSVEGIKTTQTVVVPELRPNTRLGDCPLSKQACFWTSAGLGWMVWIFSVSSAGDQNWLTFYGGGFGIKSNIVCSTTYNGDGSACAAFRSLVATQIIATLTCSIAVVLWTVAFFRPCEARRFSTKVLGFAGGILMAVSTFFEMFAFISAAIWVKAENERYWGLGSIQKGRTFGVGVTTFILGLVQAIFILSLFKAAGDGPLLSLARALAAPREGSAPGHPSDVVTGTPQDVKTARSETQVPQSETNMDQGATV